MRGDERARQQDPARLLEDEDGLGQPQADAAVRLRQAQGEEPRVTQSPPQCPVQVPGRVHGGAQGVAVEAAA